MSPETRTCPICWSPFTTSPRASRKHTYCSNRCRAEAGRRRNNQPTTPTTQPKPELVQPAATRECPHCGEHITIVALLTTPQAARPTVPTTDSVIPLRREQHR